MRVRVSPATGSSGGRDVSLRPLGRDSSSPSSSFTGPPARGEIPGRHGVRCRPAPRSSGDGDANGAAGMGEELPSVPQRVASDPGSLAPPPAWDPRYPAVIPGKPGEGLLGDRRRDQRPGRSCASLPFPLRGASSTSRPGFPYARLARPARLSHRGKPNGARSHRLAAPSRAPYRDYHFHEPSQSSAPLELHRFAECKKAVSVKAALMGGSKRLRVRGRVTSPLPGPPFARSPRRLRAARAPGRHLIVVSARAGRATHASPQAAQSMRGALR